MSVSELSNLGDTQVEMDRRRQENAVSKKMARKHREKLRRKRKFASNVVVKSTQRLASAITTMKKSPSWLLSTSTSVAAVACSQTCSEILEVIRSMGYVRVGEDTPEPQVAETEEATQSA